jgi:curved DNA-binding protein CbpA
LYDKLGVAKNATTAEIRAAYRKRARKAHPDGGGDADKFQELVKAHGILIDPLRREKYDTTGDETETTADTFETDSFILAQMSVRTAYDKSEQSGWDIRRTDLLAVARGLLRVEIEKILVVRKRAERGEHTMRELAQRFSAKRGKQNRLRVFFETQANAIARDHEKNDRLRKVHERALEIINEHKFDYDEPTNELTVGRVVFSGTTV